MNDKKIDEILAGVRRVLEILENRTLPGNLPVPVNVGPLQTKASAGGNWSAVIENNQPPMGDGSQRSVLAAARQAKPEKPSAVALRVAATMTEPITIPTLEAAVGLRVTTNYYAQQLSYWKLKGWVVSTERGKYERTKDFPGLSETGKALATAAPAAEAEVPLPPGVVKSAKEGKFFASVPDSNRLAGPKDTAAVAEGNRFQGPFTLLDLTTRCDGGQKQAGVWLADWLASRWVERAGFGQYRRTAKFPKA